MLIHITESWITLPSQITMKCRISTLIQPRYIIKTLQVLPPFNVGLLTMQPKWQEDYNHKETTQWQTTQATTHNQEMANYTTIASSAWSWHHLSPFNELYTTPSVTGLFSPWQTTHATTHHHKMANFTSHSHYRWKYQWHHFYHSMKCTLGYHNHRHTTAHHTTTPHHSPNMNSILHHICLVPFPPSQQCFTLTSMFTTKQILCRRCIHHYICTSMLKMCASTLMHACYTVLWFCSFTTCSVMCPPRRSTPTQQLHCARPVAENPLKDSHQVANWKQ